MQKENSTVNTSIFALLMAVSQYKGMQAGKEMWKTCKLSANSGNHLL